MHILMLPFSINEDCIVVVSWMVLSKLVAQQVRASLTGLCRAERPSFEPHSDHLLSIHFTLFTPSFYGFVLRTGHSHKKTEKKVNKAYTLNSFFHFTNVAKLAITQFTHPQTFNSEFQFQISLFVRVQQCADYFISCSSL